MTITKYYQLPKGAGFGWGVCGENLGAALSAKGCLELPDSPFPQSIDGDIIEALEGPTLLPVAKFNYIGNGDRQLVLGFVEDNILASKYRYNVNLYDGIICGCQNMKDELSEFLPSDFPMFVAVQGVNHSKFYFDRSCQRPDWAQDKFVVGSFGKFEYRKGQDVVIEAFKRFSEGKDDVVLAYNWYNLWPQSIQTMKASPYLTKEAKDNLVTGRQSTNHIDAALYYAGINQKAIALPFIPHSDVNYAAMYRVCNVTLFPNRKEAGTNLPLMESLACGVPTIAVSAHGHYEPMLAAHGIRSEKYTHISDGVELGTYYEPNIDDCVDRLNWDYTHRTEPNSIYPDQTKRYTWEAMADQCLDSLNS
jgi:glycosyltransferase involved in cell wall biosynthesis